MCTLILFDFEYEVYDSTLNYRKMKNARARAQEHLKEFIKFAQKQGYKPDWYDVDTWEQLEELGKIALEIGGIFAIKMIEFED